MPEADPLDRLFQNPDHTVDGPLLDQAVEQDPSLSYGSSMMEVPERDREKAQIALIRALKKLFKEDYRAEYPYGAPKINRHYD